MPQPRLGGVTLFGTAVTMATVADARARQINSFPGIDGNESLDMGSRGGTTTVSGRLIGSNLADLDGQVGQWYTLNDGVARDLDDTKGATWPNVLIDQFKPVGRVRQTPDGRSIQDYEAHLTHLTM